MLYIGDVKFVDDDRFDLLPGKDYSEWNLRFRLIREADAGNYECQISTSPKLSQTFMLNVVGMKILSRIKRLLFLCILIFLKCINVGDSSFPTFGYRS